MAGIELHPDFREFLKYLNSQEVEYLLIGGYAVGYHGYPRATDDMDVWIAVDQKNANKVVMALHEFGMSRTELTKELFLESNRVVRMGVPPVRIEIITGISGVEFRDCYSRRESIEIDSVPINVISLDDLRINKKASGRHKDLDDLSHLPS